MNRSPRNLRGIRIGPPAAALTAAACLIPAGALGWHGLDLRPLFASGLPAGSAAEQVRGRVPSRHDSGKLDSRLAELARVGGSTRSSNAIVVRGDLTGSATSGGRVRVVVEARSTASVEQAIEALGGRVEASVGTLVQALIRPVSLEALAENPAVRFVRPPLPHIAESVGGEEVAASLAAAWQAKGITGKGVKVGIVDLGFKGYTDRQASGDLPANLVTADFCGGQLSTSEPHGTAVAEIVHEMAPDAQLYLICFDSDVTLVQAEAYAKAQGVQIVNYSIGAYNEGRGDGSGLDGSLVADARANGILWVASAGNDAQRHWSGTYVDANGNQFMDWSPNDEGNTVVIPDGAVTCGFLRWDEWPVGVSDFDLLLLDSATGLVIAASDNEQTGTQPPAEELCVQNRTGSAQRLAWAIGGYRVVSSPRLDLFAVGPPLEYQTATGSIGDPASSPNALAVGALCSQTNALEFYSSQGPTIDGRTKPDLAGHDSVSSATYGPFFTCPSGFAGTSASAPEVAGAAALVKQQNPSFGPNELQEFLEKNAVDLGAAGKDDQTGSGQLRLPRLADTTPPTAQALVSSGRRGRAVRLRSRASDDGGQVRVRDQVIRKGRVIATLKSGFVSAALPTSIVVTWNAPSKLAGPVKHCVRAVDSAGNSSASSCAKVVVR